MKDLLSLPEKIFYFLIYKHWLTRVGTIWAQLAESRPAEGSRDLADSRPARICAGQNSMLLERVVERVSQILAGQGIARPLIISAGREYSGPAQI